MAQIFARYLIIIVFLNLYVSQTCCFLVSSSCFRKLISRNVKSTMDVMMNQREIENTQKFRPWKHISQLISIGLLSTMPLFGPWPSLAESTVERETAFSVEMTSPPCLVPRTKAGEESLLSRLSKAKVLMLSYHPQSFGDDQAFQVLTQSSRKILS